MDCAEIRDAFARGSVAGDANVLSHLRECQPCAALFDHDALVGRALSVEAFAQPDDSPPAFAALERTLAHERGPRAWLRSRPTRIRLLLVLAVVLALCAYEAGFKRHRGGSDFPRLSLALLVLLQAAVLIAAIRVALLGPLAVRARTVTVLAVGLVLPFVLALVPVAHGLEGPGSGPFFAGIAACFAYGSAMGFPVWAAIWLLTRAEGRGPALSQVAAVTLGLVANLVLFLHCPNREPAHLALGHAAIGALGWLACSLALWSHYRNSKTSL